MPQKIGVTQKLVLSMQNNMSDLVQLTKKADEFMQRHNYSENITYKVNLILEEVLTNIIKYAYRDTMSHNIRVAITQENNELLLEFQDDGEEFDPLGLPAPQAQGSISNAPVGGLGIYRVRKIADSVEYHRRHGKNILRASIGLRSAG